MKKLLISLFVLSSFVFSASLQEIQTSKKVKIGIRQKLPPFSNQDENGISDGFEVSLAKEIAKKLVGEDGEIEFIVLNAKDRIPLCEDRIMFIKCDFIFNHLLIDIFLKEEKENKDWMRLLLIIDNFEFIFNEIGIFFFFFKNYVFILKIKKMARENTTLQNKLT